MAKKTFFTRKLKDCAPQEKQGCCSTEILKNFYNGELEKPDRKKQASLVWFLILTIFLSFLTSLTVFLLFLSGAFYNSKLSIWLGIEPSNPNSIVVEKKETYNISEEEYLTSLLKEIAPTNVGIFLEDTKNKTVYYQNKNFVASGMIMTSDGWIVAAKNLINPQNSFVVVDQNGKIYKVLEIKTDDTWGVAYLKIEANNLPVMSLAEFKNVNQGDKIVLTAGIEGVNNKSITSRISNTHLTMTDNYIWETEKNYLYFELENKNIEQLFFGSPVVDYNKQVVGILLNNGNTNYILPASYLKKHFNMLLTVKKYTPAFLGLEYVDLSANINAQMSKGVLIVNVKDNSPLLKTNIKKDVIILKVGDDLININNNFSNLIQEYRSGDKINLTYLENNQEQKIEVELK